MKRTVILNGGKGLTRRSVLKSSRPKTTKIRQSARGEECLLQFPIPEYHDPATVVLCHDNRLESGKGMGLKAPDTAAAYGCVHCHNILDGRAPRPEGFDYETMLYMFDKAVQLTHMRLRAKGLLKDGEH